MKTRLLPDIDLARIAPLPEDMQRKSLEKIKGFVPRFSYRPFRSCYHDIMNIQPEMFGLVGTTSWEIIERNLRRKSKLGIETERNVCVARSLYNWIVESKIVGRHQDFGSMAMGSAGRVTFWCPMVLEVESRPLIPFIEPRQTYGLGIAGRRFAFSMMHEHIRAADDDYSEVSLGIFKFGRPDKDQRAVILHRDVGVELFSLKQMEKMVSTTYRIWNEVLDARAYEERQRSYGTRGSLI